MLNGCGNEQVSDQTQVSTAKVTVISIQPQSINFSENLPARVQAFRTAEIRPQVGGIIEKFYSLKVVKLKLDNLYIK